MKRTSAIALLILTGIIWSIGGFMIKLIPWSALAIAGIRSGLSSIVIIAYSKPKRFHFNKYVWLGALCYALMVISFVIGNKLTSAGNVILIQYAAPVYVAFFGMSFLGEHARKIDWVAIIIILIGLACFFIDELSFNELWGNIFALFSGIGFAGLTLFMRKQKNGNPVDSVLLGNLLTFFLCTPFYWNLTHTFNSWIYISILGFFQLGIAYVFYSIAIKHVSALDAIIYPVIEPISNPLLAFVFLNEKISMNAIIGGLLVVIGVVGRGILKDDL